MIPQDFVYFNYEILSTKLFFSERLQNGELTRKVSIKKTTPRIVITKKEFSTRDEFEECYEELDQLGQVF